MENSFLNKQQEKNQTYIYLWSGNYSLGLLSQRNENLCLHKTCTWLFIASIFVIAKLWKPRKCLSIQECINKLIHAPCGILCSSKKEWTSDVLNNLDGSQGHYAERKKPMLKDHTPCDSTVYSWNDNSIKLESCLHPNLVSGSVLEEHKLNHYPKPGFSLKNKHLS